MNSFSVTNIRPSQALRGECVKVTLDSSESSLLSQMFVGQIVETFSSQNLGTIHSIDIYGDSFTVSPIQLNLTFESLGTPGYLDAGEIIYINGELNLLLQENGYELLQEDGGAILL